MNCFRNDLYDLMLTQGIVQYEPCYNQAPDSMQQSASMDFRDNIEINKNDTSDIAHANWGMKVRLSG